jgi:putative membrane protein
MTRKRIVLAAIAAAAVAAPALANGTGDLAAGHGSGYGHMMGGWHYIFGPLMMVVGIALIVVLAVLLVRWLGGGVRGSAHGNASAARAVLDERYARGEIDRTDYLERKKDLS